MITFDTVRQDVVEAFNDISLCVRTVGFISSLETWINTHDGLALGEWETNRFCANYLKVTVSYDPGHKRCIETVDFEIPGKRFVHTKSDSYSIYVLEFGEDEDAYLQRVWQSLVSQSIFKWHNQDLYPRDYPLRKPSVT